MREQQQLDGQVEQRPQALAQLLGGHARAEPRVRADADAAVAGAEQEYQRVVALDPGHADAWSNLGSLRAAVGRAGLRSHEYAEPHMYFGGVGAAAVSPSGELQAAGDARREAATGVSG